MPDGLAEKVISLCVRRRLVYPTSEIYESVAGFFDYGPLGVELKRNLESSWWNYFVRQRDDVVGMDGALITPPSMWKASGHLDAFNDPLIACGKCKRRFRLDHLLEQELQLSVEGLTPDKMQELIKENKIRCPQCKGGLKETQPFNLMFRTQVGVLKDEPNEAVLRPETAQLIFADFKLVQQAARKRLPFGIAQIGKAFRNEIAPRNFVFRAREFNQMELEFFIHPERMDDCELPANWKSLAVTVLAAETQIHKGEGSLLSFNELWDRKMVKTKWHVYWMAACWNFLLELGLDPAHLRLRQHVSAELSHYSSETWDVEYRYPWGWKELLGVANRGDFDLKQHQEHSKKDLSFFVDETKQKVIPHVIEPSWGLERLFLTVLMDAYREKTENNETKVTLALSPRLAPVQVSVFPLMKKDGLAEKGQGVFRNLMPCFSAVYDDGGSVGRRYARADEVGTPYAVTIDYDTLTDDTVTLRDRDSTQQKRVSLAELPEKLNRLLLGSVRFSDL
ncbi:glycine--tRNA ligase [Candidatus Micrarchaeota archaeon]|nr:glycine--tRNA ligase [Candidatus Micrarchaeota archaeon]